MNPGDMVLPVQIVTYIGFTSYVVNTVINALRKSYKSMDARLIIPLVFLLSFLIVLAQMIMFNNPINQQSIATAFLTSLLAGGGAILAQELNKSVQRDKEMLQERKAEETIAVHTLESAIGEAIDAGAAKDFGVDDND